jgi:hypothetical protein
MKEPELKMLQVFAETHKKIKRLAFLDDDKPIRRYMAELANKLEEERKKDETVRNSN